MVVKKKKSSDSLLEDIPENFSRFKPLLTPEFENVHALVEALDEIIPHGFVEMPNVLKRALLSEIVVRAHLGSKDGPGRDIFEEEDLRRIARKLGWVSLCSPSVISEIGNLGYERRNSPNQVRRNEIERTLAAFGVALARVGGRVRGTRDRHPRKRRIDGQATWVEYVELANEIEERERLNQGGGHRALKLMAKSKGVSKEAIRKRLSRAKKREE